MRDDWFGHRDPLTGKPQGDKDEWSSWDFALLEAVQTIEDYTDSSGLLVWEVDDEAVYVNANRKINKFDAARESKTSGKNYKAAAGEYYVPEMKTRRSDGKFQTFREWIEKSVKAEQAD